MIASDIVKASEIVDTLPLPDYTFRAVESRKIYGWGEPPIYVVAAEWARKDLTQSLLWAQSIEGQYQREVAAVAIVDVWSELEPAESYGWAEEVMNTNMLKQALAWRITYRWEKSDSAGMRKWLEREVASDSYLYGSVAYRMRSSESK